MTEAWHNTLTTAWEQPLFWCALVLLITLFGVKEYITRSIDWRIGGQIISGWILAGLIG